MNNHTSTVRAIVLVLAAICMLGTLAVAEQPMFQGKPILEGTWNNEPAQWVAGEILVRFQDGNIDPTDVVQSVNGKLIRGVEPNGFAIIEVDQSADIPTLCQLIYDSYPYLQYVEPNLIHTIQEWTPNDQYYNDGHQYGLRNTGQDPPDGVPDADVNPNWAWDYTSGSSSVVLAILDTGIDMDTASMTLRHYDLNDATKIILGQDCVGDGYGVADFHSHGTHVAGIASAETNNSWGIAGVAGGCKILVIQVFNQYGYATSTSVGDGITYAVNYQLSHPSYRVVMSYSGGGTSYSAHSFSALQYAETNDVPFVTASGNAGSSSCLYPCRHASELDNVTCVGSSNANDERSSFSNYCNDVIVIAPGGYGGTANDDDIWSCYLENSYAYKWGTSMATPHVTGIYGLVCSVNSSISSLDLRTLLEETADDEVGTLADDPQGYDNKHGWGRANAWSAIIHSPTYVTPYMRQNQRLSNTYATSSQEIFYRLAPPPNGNWEAVATRPHAGVDINCRWIDTNGSTTLAFSGLGGENVDFVLARNRPTTGLDMYARIYNYSGTGKYSAEYEQATESYIGSMYQYDHEWESSHVVDIYEVYLQNNHRYLFRAAVASGEVDIGIALLGPSGVGATYTNRSAAILDVDSYGSGSTEYIYQTVTSGDGWYAFVIYSTNGRNGVMDIMVEERVNNDSPIVLTEYDNVSVMDGYFYSYLPSGSNMGVIGIRPETGNNYNLYLYSSMNYGGSYLAYSTYTTSYADFILFDRDLLSTGQYYPKVTETVLNPGNTGYTMHKEETDEVLSTGSNGPYTFDDEFIIHAWDLYMTNGNEYDITADITSGSLDIGIGLFKQDATFKGRSSYFRYAYTYGAGIDESITWECDSTGYYTLVAWSRNGVTGTYYIDFGLAPPNLVTTVASGWDYEFVPRNTSGASSGSCHITATLPGNTANTYLNFTALNDAVNPVPAVTFYDQLYLDGAFFFQRPWSTGLSGGSTLYHLNWTTTAPIRGGKHTVELRLDGTNTIVESSEADNSAFNQFIWSPYVLTKDVPVVRDVPPPYSTMFAQPDCDGFEFTRSGYYAYGVAVCPVVSGEDYNLRLYDDYTGSEQGFDSLRVLSGGGSLTEFAVATWSGVASTAYAGIYDWLGTGTGDFVIEATDAAGKILTATDETMRDTLLTNQILNVYESNMIEDTSYTITVDNVSGTADIALALYGPDYGYYARPDHVAFCNYAGPHEEIVYVPTTSGYHVIVVFKLFPDELAPQNIYDIAVEKTLPNLITYTPPQWNFEIVPRSSAASHPDTVYITATLPGNTSNTYLNFAIKNDAPVPVPALTFYDQLYLDGSFFFERPWSSGLPADGSLRHWNWTTTTPIRGGRHTLELRADGTDTITESDETDNSAFRQFVWSPYTLYNGVAVSRSAPPPHSYIFPQPDADGFQFTRSPVFAYGIAMASLDTSDNYNMRVYDDYVGSTNGYESLIVFCESGIGATEIAIATYDNTVATSYPAVYHWYGAGTSDFVIEAIDAEGKVLDPSTDDTMRDTLATNQMLNVYEAYLVTGNSYMISVDNISGTANLALAIYGPDYGYYARMDYAAYSDDPGPDEEITFIPTGTSYHVIAVYRPDGSELPTTNIYDISVNYADVNLTHSTPNGWTYPVVPRNVPGATSGNCVLTDTLPGNTNDTYLNYCSYNEGPGPVNDQYWNYIYVDSVSWFGAPTSPPHPVGDFEKHLNYQSSNVIRGGRHTMAVNIDRFDDIAETDETDNWWSHQFIWTPYILSNYTPVIRDAPPRYGSGPRPNCDGFEYTTSWWGAVGMIPYDLTENYNLSIFTPWVDSENGFDIQLTGSGWAVGLCDFVIANDLNNGSATYDVGVKQCTVAPGSDLYVIQQANQQATWYSPGTYGPYTIAAGEVMGVWEVYLTPAGPYSFEVDVISGTANLGTSIYSGADSTYGRGQYFPGGYSNSAPGGSNESFTINSPFPSMYFGWAVWKASSVGISLSCTFNLIWGPPIAPVPMPVDDLVIERIDSTGARLIWNQVTQDTTGNPLTIDYYRIHRNLDPGFIPTVGDSIGYTATGDTTYDDLGVVWNNVKYFYQVIAVDTDGVVAASAEGEETPRVILSVPPRENAPESVRMRYQR